MALQVLNTAAVREAVHSIIYGDPKTGKTSTLGECGYRVLLADMEGGSSVLEGAANIDRIPVNSWEDLIEFGKSVRQGYIDLGNGQKFKIDHDMVAVDSLSRAQELCKEYIATVYAPNRKREIVGKFGAMADWGDLTTQLTGLVKGFHSLTKNGDKSVHVTWIAHKGVNKDDISGAITGTKIQLQGGNTAEIIMSYVDALFYMVKRPNKDKPEELEYGVLTDQAGIFQAGVRQSKFTKNKLDKFIVEPHWKTIYEFLGYK
jgi:hypothetical protein